MTEPTAPLLNSPAALLLSQRPVVGTAIPAGIVVDTRWISPDIAEDFDWFEVADAGGVWQVQVREPRTDDETAAVRQARDQEEQAQEETIRLLVEQRALEEKKAAEELDRRSADAETLKAFVSQHPHQTDYWTRADLVEGTRRPFQRLEATGFGDGLVSLDEVTLVNGETGYVQSFGNRSVLHASAVFIDEVNERFYQSRMVESPLAHALGTVKHRAFYPNCVGGDYCDWVWARHEQQIRDTLRGQEILTRPYHAFETEHATQLAAQYEFHPVELQRIPIPDWENLRSIYQNQTGVRLAEFWRHPDGSIRGLDYKGHWVQIPGV